MEKGKKKIYKYDYERISVQYTKGEKQELKKKVANSTCRTTSEFIRKATLGRPLYVFYRNKSFDEFVDECIALRKEMRTIRETMPLDSLGIARLLAIQENIQSSIIKLANQCALK
jgi:hypothetical protein